MIKLLNKNCKFLITGATGFIGSRLCYELLEDGHQIVALTRSKNKISGHQNLIYINNLSEHEFNYDIIINLAGAPISVYWTRKNQQEIYQSRLKITAEIVEKIASAKNPPKLLINGSAIGFTALPIRLFLVKIRIVLNKICFHKIYAKIGKMKP